MPWKGGASLKTPEEGGWTVVGPSPIPFAEGDPVPVPLDEAGIEGVIDAFEAAARACPGGRLPGDRDPFRPWLPAARVSFAALQSSPGPVWR